MEAQRDLYENALLSPQDRDLAWPTNDVIVATPPRDRRTKVAFEELKGSSPGSYTKYAHKYFSQNWRAVSLATNSGQAQSRPFPASTLRDQSFPQDAETADKSSDYVDFAGQGPYSFSPNDTAPKLYRLMFVPPPTPVVDFSKKEAPIHHPKYEEILVNCKQLTFNLDLGQPFFCTLALYDLNGQKRMSEDFHFHTNTPDQMKQLSSAAQGQSPKNAIFRLPPGYRSEGLYFILIVSKVLKDGDPDAFVDLYSKEKIKDKEKEKLKEEIKESTGRLYEFRQNVCWAGLPVFPGGKPNTSKALTFRMARMNKNADIFLFIEELEKSSKSKNATSKGEFGNCTIEVSYAVPPTVARFDPCRSPVFPAPEGSNNEVAYEVQGFYHDQAPLFVHSEYINNLHIYPGVFSFSKLKYKTIGVEVRLRPDDSNAASVETLDVIYSTEFGAKPFQREKMCSVWYGTKKAKYLDEIKIALPFEVTSKHNLLFTFYSISSKIPKKDKPQANKEVIGYAFLQLFKDHKIVSTKQPYELSVARELPPFYLSADDEQIPWLEGKKVTLSVEFQLASAVYPQDPFLSAFLSSSCGGDAAIKNLEQANAQDLVRFLPHTFYVLSKYLSSSDLETTKVAFSGLVHTIERVYQQSGLEHFFLDGYIQSIFEVDDFPNLWVTLVKSWTWSLEKNLQEANNSVRHHRHIFAMIIKSMTQSFGAKGLLADDSNREKRLSDSEAEDLGDLIHQLSYTIQEHFCIDQLNTELGRFLAFGLAHFMKDLFSIIHRGFAFELIQKIFTDWDEYKPHKENPEKWALKLCFLRILAHSPLYTMLNCPKIHSDPSAEIKKWTNHHFLAGTLCSLVKEILSTGKKSDIAMVCNVLTTIFWLHDNDPRYTNPSTTQLIASLYFPILCYFIEEWQTIKELSILDDGFKEEKRLVFCALGWIIQNCNPAYLHKWWSNQTERGVVCFFKLIRKILDLFQYTEENKIRTLRTSEFQTILSERLSALPQMFLTDQEVLEIESKKFGKEIKDSTRDHNSKEKKPKKTEKTPQVKEKFVVDPVIRDFIRLSKSAALALEKIDCDQQIILEKNFIHGSSMLCLNVILLFISKFQNLLFKRPELFDEAFTVLIQFLNVRQPSTVLSRTFRTLHFFDT